VKITFLFQIWPYVALAILALGLVARFVLTGRASEAFNAELARAREIFAGGKLWRAGILLLLSAHLAGLLVPGSVVLWNSVPARLYLLEGAGLLLALVVLAGWAAAAWRHLSQSNGSLLGEIADALFLSVSLVAIVSGLLTALFYRWGSNWGTVILTPYLTSLLTGRPSATLVTQMPFLVQLHVFSAFGVAAALPFSGVAAFLIAALHRLLALADKPFAAGGRSAEAWLRRHNPAAWIWPEED
jgi:nitrate reductase gamma subunit